MKSMKMLMSATVVAVSMVGCGGQSAGSAETPRQTAQNLGPNGEMYGSDTLKGAIVAANTSSGAGLLYKGTGTSVGETCLRGGGSTVCPNPKQQSLAPMSRDLRAPCQAGEKSNVIALDAVNIFVKSDNGLSNIAKSSIANIFFQAPAGACWTSWSQVPGSTRTGTIKVYRRDDLSGTTDVFKDRVASSSAVFCNGANVQIITDGSSSNPAPCTAADSATVCIGKLTAADANAIGFAGDSAKLSGNVALSVDGIAPSVTNIRKLISGASGVYPLARKIFLNENTTSTRSVEEEILYSFIYDTDTAAFEQILKNQGFIACSDSAPLACGGVNNDGRGAGLCQ